MKILKKNIPIKSKLFDAHVLLTAILLRFGFASIFTDIVSGFRVSSERGSLYTISGEKNTRKRYEHDTEVFVLRKNNQAKYIKETKNTNIAYV